MVVKNMDIWASRGNNPKYLYNNSNQVIIQYKKVEKKKSSFLIIKKNTITLIYIIIRNYIRQ